MTYASKEDARAYAKRHYEANKWGYNPGRSHARQAARKARAEVLSLSMDRWISPKMIAKICAKHLLPSVQPGLLSFCFDACTRGIPGCAEGGVLMGRSPFMPEPYYGPRRELSISDQWLRDAFLRALPKREKEDAGVELLILRLILINPFNRNDRRLTWK